MKRSAQILLTLLVCVLLTLSVITAVSATETVSSEEITWNTLESADDWNAWFSGAKESKLMTEFGGTGQTAYLKLNNSITVTSTAMYYIGSGSVTCNVVIDLDGHTLTLEGTRTGRVFGIYASSHLTIQNGTLVNGVPSVGVHGGFLFLNSGTMDLQNLTLTDNSTAAYNCNGKLISVGGSCTLNMTDVDVYANTQNSTVTLYESGNFKYGAGGIISTGGTVNMTRCNLSASNTSNAEKRIQYGGIIYVTGGNSTFTDCAFTGGIAEYGGAVLVSGGNVTAEGTTFTGGTASYGGSVSVIGGTTALNNCTFTQSSAKYGGAVDVEDGGTLTLDGCTITNTTATTRGGGVFVYKNSAAVAVEMNNTTITGCSANNGGGFAVYGKGTCHINGGMIQECSALTGSGGGVFLHNTGYVSGYPCVVMENATVSGCGSVNNGGSFYVANSSGYLPSMMTLNNCTVSGGSVSGDGQFGGNIYMAGVDYTDDENNVLRSTITINGGRIENGTAVSWGGNIGIAGYSDFVVNGAVITGGQVTKASSCGGGNVYMGNPNAVFNFNSGTISCGSTSQYGGNVRIGGGTFNMYGGLIEEGAAGVKGSSVFVNNAATARFYMYGGTIQHTDSDSVLFKSTNAVLNLYNGVVHGFDPTAFLTDCTEVAADESTLTFVITHKKLEGVTLRDAPCDQAGNIITDCPTCAHVYTYPVAAGHTRVILPAVPATCITTGLTEGHYCFFCDGDTVAQTVTAVTGHTYDGGVYTEPTTESDGYTTFTCGVCSHSYTVADEGSKVICAIITSQPENVEAEVGEIVTFRVVAVNGVSYQWQYRRGENATWYNSKLSGCSTNTLSVGVTLARDGYQYRCVVVGYDDVPVESDVATLAANATLAISQQPKTQSAVLGTNAQFAVEATSSYTVAYRWQYRRSETDNWSDSTLDGYNTAILTVPVTAARNGYQYRCVVSDNRNCTIVSDAATLRLGEAAEILTEPASQKAYWNTQAQFSVSASNVHTYQWQYRRSETSSWFNTGLDGFDTHTLTVDATAARNGYQYRCRIIGLDGVAIYTQNATLTVGSDEAFEPVVILSQPASLYGSVGDTVIFVVEAEGEQLQYQWQIRKSDSDEWTDSALDGFDTEMLFVDVIKSRDGYQFRCIVTDVAGNAVISEAATLYVD